MAEAYTNEAAYHSYQRHDQTVRDLKERRKELWRECERTGEQMRKNKVGPLQERLTALRAVMAPLKEQLAQIETAIEENHQIANEQFDIWKGLK
jgi:peptidoglycan hydrolase CwlO-like protein